MFTEAVRETLLFPAVPEEMYPAVVTEGVTLTLFVNVSVPVPVVNVAPVPVIVEGAVTEPLATALIV